MKKLILKSLLILALFMNTSSYTYAQPNHINEPLVHVISDETPTQEDKNSVGVLLTLLAITVLISLKTLSDHNDL